MNFLLAALTVLRSTYDMKVLTVVAISIMTDTMFLTC